MSFGKHPRKPARTSWEPVADWYNGWVGAGGSNHHRSYALPAVLDLLAPQAGELLSREEAAKDGGARRAGSAL